MLPVLFSIGPIAISSFGFFLSLGFLYGTFLIWRLSRAWDLNEEKILDLVLLTFFGALLGARLFFVLEHSSFFLSDPLRSFLITKYPGFSIWGALFGGWIGLVFLSKKFKVDFWKIVDVFAVGLLAGMIFGQIGCFLGGCNVGIKFNSFLGVDQVGVVGKRFPIQIVEVLILIFILRRIWYKATHFHISGKIVSLTFIFLGLVEGLTGFLKEDREQSLTISSILIFIGAVLFYKIGKRNLNEDLRVIGQLIADFLTNKKTRITILQNLLDYCYNMVSSFLKNTKIQWNWRLRNLDKFLRKIHVKHTPKNTF